MQLRSKNHKHKKIYPFQLEEARAPHGPENASEVLYFVESSGAHEDGGAPEVTYTLTIGQLAICN